MENEVNITNKQEPQTDLAEQGDQNLEVNSSTKKDPKHQKNRFGLLAILISSSCLILWRSLTDNNIGKPTPFKFPERIEFALTQTKKLEIKLSTDIVATKEFFGQPKYLFGKSYSYSLDGINVDIDLRYAVGTDGDIFLFIKELTNIKISEDELLQKSILKMPIGYYANFTYNNRTYLTACINPRGISTVTKDQFEDNASDRAMDRDVIVDWLLGQKDLRDRRCLWTLMSTPLTSNNDINATNQKLEKVWISWYEWWKVKFPQA